MKQKRLIKQRRRLRVISLLKDWKCSCGVLVKKGKRAARYFGFQVCRSCLRSKAPDIFRTKGWNTSEIWRNIRRV